MDWVGNQGGFGIGRQEIGGGDGAPPGNGSIAERDCSHGHRIEGEEGGRRDCERCVRRSEGISAAQCELTGRDDRATCVGVGTRERRGAATALGEGSTASQHVVDLRGCGGVIGYRETHARSDRAASGDRSIAERNRSCCDRVVVAQDPGRHIEGSVCRSQSGVVAKVDLTPGDERSSLIAVGGGERDRSGAAGDHGAGPADTAAQGDIVSTIQGEGVSPDGHVAGDIKVAAIGGEVLAGSECQVQSHGLSIGRVVHDAAHPVGDRVGSGEGESTGSSVELDAHQCVGHGRGSVVSEHTAGSAAGVRHELKGARVVDEDVAEVSRVVAPLAVRDISGGVLQGERVRAAPCVDGGEGEGAVGSAEIEISEVEYEVVGAEPGDASRESAEGPECAGVGIPVDGCAAAPVRAPDGRQIDCEFVGGTERAEVKGPGPENRAVGTPRGGIARGIVEIPVIRAAAVPDHAADRKTPRAPPQSRSDRGPIGHGDRADKARAAERGTAVHGYCGRCVGARVGDRSGVDDRGARVAVGSVEFHVSLPVHGEARVARKTVLENRRSRVGRQEIGGGDGAGLRGHRAVPHAEVSHGNGCGVLQATPGDVERTTGRPQPVRVAPLVDQCGPPVDDGAARVAVGGGEHQVCGAAEGQGAASPDANPLNGGGLVVGDEPVGGSEE